MLEIHLVYEVFYGIEYDVRAINAGITTSRFDPFNVSLNVSPYIPCLAFVPTPKRPTS